jgi:hypothetical protein
MHFSFYSGSVKAKRAPHGFNCFIEFTEGKNMLGICWAGKMKNAILIDFTIITLSKDLGVIVFWAIFLLNI